MQNLSAMESESNYLAELLAEKDSLDPSFLHSMQLLTAGRCRSRVHVFAFLYDFDRCLNHQLIRKILMFLPTGLGKDVLVVFL